MLRQKGILKIKLKKYKCEICKESNIKILDFHHIIPQSDKNCTNFSSNIAIICANCHRKTHSGSIKIIGIISSTEYPNKRTLVYEIDGIKNIDIDIPKYK